MMQNKNKNKQRIAVCNIGLLSVLMIIFLVHFAIVNAAAGQRYKISKLMNQYSQLQSASQKLSITAADLQSPERLFSESSRLKLVKVDTIRYIAPKAAVVLNTK